MRTHRKRPWAALTVNMTPLIDVVFLIIIFFIIMINFSEMHLKNVNLPKADESKTSDIELKSKIHLTIRSADEVFLERKKVSLENLVGILRHRLTNPKDTTVQLRADENVTYDVIEKIMIKVALAHINKIEFFSAIFSKPIFDQLISLLLI